MISSVGLEHLGFVSEGADRDFDLHADNDGNITVVWLNTEKTQPTNEEIETADAEWHSQNDHKFKRVNEYPDIGDQLDALFHAGVFPEDMAATIQAVKDKYPKEAE